MVLRVVDKKKARPRRVRAGQYDSTRPPATGSDAARPPEYREEDVVRVPTDPTPGRSLVARRAIVDIVRTATLGSYGVTGLSLSLPERVLAWLGLAHPGIRVTFRDQIDIELDLTVAFGLPVAEVARQVDSAVRYAVRRAIAREVGRLTIHVNGLRYQPGGPPPGPEHRDGRAPAGATAASSAATSAAPSATPAAGPAARSAQPGETDPGGT